MIKRNQVQLDVASACNPILTSDGVRRRNGARGLKKASDYRQFKGVASPAYDLEALLEAFGADALIQAVEIMAEQQALDTANNAKRANFGGNAGFAV